MNANKQVLIGRILSVVVCLPLIMSAVMKVVGGQQVVEGMTHLGWPLTTLYGLAALELMSVVVYLIPRTSVLGAILFTGYMGGAMATHLRIGEPLFIQLGVGIVAWLGIYLREPRLREIMPLRK